MIFIVKIMNVIRSSVWAPWLCNNHVLEAIDNYRIVSRDFKVLSNVVFSKYWLVVKCILVALVCGSDRHPAPTPSSPEQLCPLCPASARRGSGKVGSGSADLRHQHRDVAPPLPEQVETDSWEYSMKLYFLEVKCILSNNYISNFALVNDIYLCCKQDNNYFIHFGGDNAPLP